MQTVEQLCKVYLSLINQRDNSTLAQKRQLENTIASKLLVHPDVLKLINVTLYRNKLSSTRAEDLLQDTVSTFVMNVLPKLRDPDFVFGAMIQIAKRCALRLNQSRLDAELTTMLSLNGEPDKNKGASDDYLVSKSSLYNNNTNSVDWLDQNHNIDPDRVGLFMKSEAIKAIRKILDNPEKASQPLSNWMPITPDALANPSLSKNLQAMRTKKADELGGPPQPRYQNPVKHQDDENTRWLDVVVFNQTKLTAKILGELLGIPASTLSAYHKGRVKIPSHTLKHIERWFFVYGTKIVQWQNEAAKRPMVELVDQWKEQLGVSKNIDLAHLLEVTPATIARWNSEKELDSKKTNPNRPNPSRLFDVELKVSKILYENHKKEWLSDLQERQVLLSYLVRDWMKRIKVQTPEELADFVGEKLLPTETAVAWHENIFHSRYALNDDQLFAVEHFIQTAEEKLHHSATKKRIIAADGDVKSTL